MERIPIIQRELAEEIEARRRTQVQLETEIRRGSQFRRSAALGYVILLLGLGLVWNIGQNDNEQAREANNAALVQSGSAVAVDGCNRDYASIQGIRAFLQRSKDIQQRNVANGSITQEQADRGEEFYDLLLDSYPLPDCRKADDVITSNPADASKVPTPRYPGDTNPGS